MGAHSNGRPPLSVCTLLCREAEPAHSHRQRDERVKSNTKAARNANKSGMHFATGAPIARVKQRTRRRTRTHTATHHHNKLNRDGKGRVRMNQPAARILQAAAFFQSKHVLQKMFMGCQRWERVLVRFGPRSRGEERRLGRARNVAACVCTHMHSARAVGKGRSAPAASCSARAIEWSRRAPTAGLAVCRLLTRGHPLSRGCCLWGL